MTIRKRRVATFEWRCRCERCGHSWKVLGPKPPERCSACKALHFDRPARQYRRRKA